MLCWCRPGTLARGVIVRVLFGSANFALPYQRPVRPSQTKTSQDTGCHRHGALKGKEEEEEAEEEEDEDAGAGRFRHPFSPSIFYSRLVPSLVLAVLWLLGPS